jgi:hypothetical protein
MDIRSRQWAVGPLCVREIDERIGDHPSAGPLVANADPIARALGAQPVQKPSRGLPRERLAKSCR